jgi:hypothetical protein
MKKNPLQKGVLTGNPADLGPVTREMVHARSRELAMLAGRSPHQVTRADYEQAMHELTGESDKDRQDAALDAHPGSKRREPVPGSTGHQAPEYPGEDADDEGRSESELLAVDGSIEAVRDRQFRAALAARAGDRAHPEQSSSP